jgi:FKBP-type peptidyl-prolyl cis-trans isomerase
MEIKATINVFFIGALAFILGACSGYSNTELAAFDDEIQALLIANNLTMDRLENGLYIDVIHSGNGEELIKITDEVTFYYTGYLSDGSVFQSIPKDEPLTFPVRSLIAGWQDALSFVSEGGKLKVIIPPQLGYGSKNTELVPPNSVLMYDMTVVEVR